MSAHRYVIENDSPSINNDTGSPELLSVKAVKVTFEVEEGTDINAPPEDLFSPLGSTTLEAGLTDENTIAVHSSSPQEVQLILSVYHEVKGRLTMLSYKIFIIKV